MRRLLYASSILRLVAALAVLLPLRTFGAGPKIGAPAPPLNLAKVLQATNTTEATWDNLRGKVVVLDFWATWCGPCVAAIPHWNDLAKQFHGKPVVFLAISNEDEPLVTAFLKRKPIQAWVGLEGNLQSTRDRYGIWGIPTTVIVNQDGLVVAVAHPLKIEAKDLQEVLDTKRSSLPPPPQEKPPQNPVTSVSVTNGPPLFEVSIRRSGPRIASHGWNVWSWSRDRLDIEGRYTSVKTAIFRYFQVRPSLVDVRTDLPEVDYDFDIRLPSGGQRDIEQLFGEALRRTFGVEARRTTEERDVFVLSVTRTNAPGLVLSDPTLPSTGPYTEIGNFDAGGLAIEDLLPYFDDWLGKPVVDETGLTNRFDVQLKWKTSPTEELRSEFSGRGIWYALAYADDTNAWNRLTDSDRKVVAAVQGKLAAAEFNSFDPALQARIRLLRTELTKLEEKRFAPDPASIRRAVEEQLGLKLTPARRKVELLAVEKVSLGQSISATN